MDGESAAGLHRANPVVQKALVHALIVLEDGGDVERRARHVEAGRGADGVRVEEPGDVGGRISLHLTGKLHRGVER